MNNIFLKSPTSRIVLISIFGLITIIIKIIRLGLLVSLTGILIDNLDLKIYSI